MIQFRFLTYFSLVLFLVSFVSAQTVFNSPYTSITIRDSVTQKPYTVLLLAYDFFIGNALDSDRGFNPFESGAIVYTSVATGVDVTFSDFNIVSLNNDAIVEFASGNSIDILTPTGWVSGAGYVFAFIASASSPALGSENGLGSLAYASSIGFATNYFNYQSLTQQQATPDRLYGAQRILSSSYSLTPYTTPAGGMIYPASGSPDSFENIFTLETTYPIYSASALTLAPNAQGFCPASPGPSYSINVYGPTATVPECYYLNQYIGYHDLNTLTSTTEGSLAILAGSPASSSAQGGSFSGIFEAHPSVSKNPSASLGNYLIARESNYANLPMTSSFDIFVYNTLMGVDVGVVPELSTGSQNQIRPVFAFPWVAFLEVPDGVYMTYQAMQGNLGLWNINTNSRTTVPLATSIPGSSLVDYPALAYDSTSSSGILAFVSGGGGSLDYYLLDQNGVTSTIPSSIPIPFSIAGFYPNSVAVTSSGGNHYIYYAGYVAGTFEVHRYDVSAFTDSLLYTNLGLSFAWGYSSSPALRVSADNKFVSFDVFPAGGGTVSSLLLTVDSSCTTLPCASYLAGNACRTYSSGTSCLGISDTFFLDSDVSTSIVPRYSNFPIPIPSTSGVIDISNF